MRQSVTSVKSEPFFLDLFQRARHELSLELDYMQYSHFLKCFLLTEVQTEEDLLFLCESLWLPNPQYRTAFRKLFDDALLRFRQNTLEPLRAIRTVVQNDPVQPATPPTPQQGAQPIQEVVPKVPPAPPPPPSVATTTPPVITEWPEIRLKVKDSATGFSGYQQEKHDSTSYSNIPFLFSVEKALPFGMRKAAQLWTRLPAPPHITATDTLDVQGLIRQKVNDGVFHELLYETVKSGRQQIVWLTDHQGSMNPFAAWEDSLLDIVKDNKQTESVHRYFFHDFPAQKANKDFLLFTNAAHTASVTLAKEARKRKWNRQTLIIIFSDGGAAHQKKDDERVKVFFELNETLRCFTNRLLWINPVRHTDHTTAQVISFFMNMIYPDTLAISRMVAGLPPLKVPTAALPQTNLFSDKYSILHSFNKEEDRMDKARTESFLERYPSDAHWWMACHLTYPIALTADLVHQVWVNFKKDETGHQADIPLWVADEVLHSPLVREMGNGLYEMYPKIREALLTYLREKESIWGPDREKRLAEFVQDYLRFRRAKVPTEALAVAETLNYKVLLEETAVLMKEVDHLLALANQTANKQEKLQAQQKIAVLLNINKSRKLLASTTGDAIGTLKDGQAEKTSSTLDPLDLLSTINKLQKVPDLSNPVKINEYRSLFLHLQQTENAGEGFVVNLSPAAQAELITDKLVTVHTASEKPEVYALLVGINNYKRKPLEGCVNDVENMESCLRKMPGRLNLLTLKEEQATKKAIVSAFRSFLSRARPQDTVLVYLAGLGTKEYAAKQFISVSDLHECFITYDGNSSVFSDFLLNSLELMFLYYELYQSTNVHILSIYDFSSSFENYPKFTEKKNFNNVKTRHLTDTGGRPFPQREASGFIFPDEVYNDAWNRIPYTNLSASNYKSTAIEAQALNGVRVEGVFTRQLIQELLEANFRISYVDLAYKASSYTKPLYRQVVQLYVNETDGNLASNNFLRLNISSGLQFPIIREEQGGYLIPIGVLHGVTANTSFYCSFVDEEKNKKDLQKGEIISINLEYTRLGFRVPEEKHRSPRYAEVTGLMPNPLIIHIKNHDGDLKILQQIIETVKKESKDSIQFSNYEDSAHYVLHNRNGLSYLTLPFDTYRPLLKPVPGLNQQEVSGIVNTIRQISQWQMLRQLKNIPSAPLQVELFHVLNEEEIPIAIIENKIDLEDTLVMLKIRITNRSQIPLYVAPLYYGVRFDVMVNFTESGTFMLQPGESISSGESGMKSLFLSNSFATSEYNLKEEIEYLQFISSPEDFAANGIPLQGLPGPPRLGRERQSEPHIAITSTSPDLSINRFMTQQCIQLNIKNPEYNSIHHSNLKVMLNNYETVDFVRGVYYNVLTDQYLQPLYYKLKPEINLTIVGEAGIKLLHAGDNVGIQTIQQPVHESSRWRAFKQSVKSDRTRILALGDSWFSYPLKLRDIVDYLASSFAIFSDTLIEIENTNQRKIIWNHIDAGNPAFILISIGMQDLFTDRFPEFIKPSDDEPKTKARQTFNIHPSFYAEMDILEEKIIRIILTVTRLTSVELILHGYDYFVPMPGNDMAWLGKCFLERGITERKEQELIIRRMLDAWNDRLMLISAKLGSKEQFISYLDLRNTLEPGQWYDEFHPNDEGFSKIADRFEGLIGNMDERVRQRNNARSNKEWLETAKLQYKSRSEEAKENKTFDPEDPQKNLWNRPGDVNYGYTIKASVTSEYSSLSVFTVSIVITKEENAYAYFAAFILHDTFTPMIQVVSFTGAEAKLTLVAYEAFTLGVLLSDGSSLEQDLQTLPDDQCPKGFKYTNKPEDVLSKLTIREKEILILTAQGFNNKEIAEKLNLSRYTIQSHLKNIRSKLKVTNTPDLIALGNQLSSTNPFDDITYK
ncbi:hypothetical protein GFS24_07700 [Chitinophaga sp. SYP-B3965]|uniref:LuxR C-terminal-related transcriptional regulator n=1 Tax=Chitinophaga sp. SYP-B3965 TaxID=2663120 RepID=UPI001299BD62|nr:LuxR C-terminal-related transcriptional regulator [Chitinophaga sp. SYP-B3965]MRG44993.1 hypothetical protein [Chitinophaga sp. SYP-B3965]